MFIENYPPLITETVLAFIFLFFCFILIQFKVFFPYVLAKFQNKLIAGIVDKAGKLRLEVAQLRNGMYYWEGKPEKWLKQFHSAPLWLGSVPIDIMHRDIGYVSDPKYQAALATLEEEAGIDNYEKLYDAIVNNKLKASWFTLGEKDMIVPLFFRVPYENILKYANDVPPASLTGEAEDIAFFNARANPDAKISDFLKYAIVFAVLVIGAAIAYTIITG